MQASRDKLNDPASSNWELHLQDANTLHAVVITADEHFVPAADAHERVSAIISGIPGVNVLGTEDGLSQWADGEGIEHFGNPDLFFKTAHKRLVPGGQLIVTTPNVWFPEARLQFLLRGFFPSFPCLVGRIERGSHMHIMPWSFAHLYLFLRLNGFEKITLHDIDEPKPKRLYERLLGLPQSIYCRHKRAKSLTEEERIFWSFAGSAQSIYGRRLVVSAATPNPAVHTNAAR